MGVGLLFLLSSGLQQSEPDEDTAQLRVATWNIHGAATGLHRIVHELRKHRPDIVCVQEAEKETANSRGFSQSARIAEMLTMKCYSAGSTFTSGGEQHMAILSTLPFKNPRKLDAQTGRIYGVMVDVQVAGQTIHVICVHLTGTYKVNVKHVASTSAARFRESEHLCRLVETLKASILLAGDFNATQQMAEHRCLSERLRPLPTSQPTFPSDRPTVRLDEIYFSKRLQLQKAQIIPSPASDHCLIFTIFGQSW